LLLSDTIKASVWRPNFYAGIERFQRVSGAILRFPGQLLLMMKSTLEQKNDTSHWARVENIGGFLYSLPFARRVSELFQHGI
jgi:hypothetical protein